MGNRENEFIGRYTCDCQVQEFQSLVIFFFESEFYGRVDGVDVLDMSREMEIRIIVVDQEYSIIHIAFVVDDLRWREKGVGFNMVVNEDAG